jgi:hypothetical protein
VAEHRQNSDWPRGIDKRLGVKTAIIARKACLIAESFNSTFVRLPASSRSVPACLVRARYCERAAHGARGHLDKQRGMFATKPPWRDFPLSGQICH